MPFMTHFWRLQAAAVASAILFIKKQATWKENGKRF